MTIDVYQYSTTPLSNSGAPPDGWPEGMQRKAVNDTGRESWAHIAQMLRAFPWMNFAKGAALTRTSATRLTITGVDLTSVYTKRRRIKITGTTPATAFGTIFATAFSGGNTIVDCYFEGDTGVPTVPTKAEVSIVDLRSEAGELFLRELSASGSAQIDLNDVMDSDFNEYVVRFDNVVPATDAVSLTVRASINNGVAFVSTGSYNWAAAVLSNFPGQSEAGLVAAAQWDIVGNVATFRLSNVAGESLAGELRIRATGTGAQRTFYTSDVSYISDGAFSARTTGGGNFVGASAINSLRFFMSSGNIATGRFRIYGVKGTPS